MLDSETAKNFAKKLKIDLFTTYREYLQLSFLKFYYSYKESSNVFFKGGTAIRFLLGSFRFSEDLDFSSPIDIKILKDIIDRTIKELNREGNNVEFKVSKKLADSYSGRIFQSLSGYDFALTIKLDFSLRDIPFKTESSVIETILPISPNPVINHLLPEEILSEKVRAFLVRAQGRDIFDIWYLLSKKVNFNFDLINKKLRIYNKNFEFKNFIKEIEKFPDKELRSNIIKFLPVSHRNIVNNLKQLLLEKLKDYTF